MPPGREHRFGDERGQGARALPVDQVERIVELGEPVEPAVAGDETGSIGVRCEHRHRPDRRRAVATSTRRVRRPTGSTRHAVPALGEPDDLPAAGHDLGQLQRGLVGLGAGREEQHLRQTRRQPAERLGEVDHRPRQHPGEEVIEAADHLRHDRHDLRVRVTQDRAHLPAGEVQHPPPGRVLDERPGRPLGHERRPRRAVPQEVALGAPEILGVGHRAHSCRRTGPVAAAWCPGRDPAAVTDACNVRSQREEEDVRPPTPAGRRVRTPREEYQLGR